jgi:hypothetical protein
VPDFFFSNGFFRCGGQSEPPKGKMQNLEICMEASDPSIAQTAQNYYCFTSFRSVSILILFREELILRFFSDDREIESSELWKRTRLMHMVQGFRARGLKKENTRVVFVPYGVDKNVFGFKGRTVGQKNRMEEVSGQATKLLLRPVEKRVFDRKGRGVRTSLWGKIVMKINANIWRGIVFSG